MPDTCPLQPGVAKVHNYKQVFVILLLLLLAVTSTEGLTATCAAALGLPKPNSGLRLNDLTY